MTHCSNRCVCQLWRCAFVFQQKKRIVDCSCILRTCLCYDFHIITIINSHVPALLQALTARQCGVSAAACLRQRLHCGTVGRMRHGPEESLKMLPEAADFPRPKTSQPPGRMRHASSSVASQSPRAALRVLVPSPSTCATWEPGESCVTTSRVGVVAFSQSV